MCSFYGFSGHSSRFCWDPALRCTFYKHECPPTVVPTRVHPTLITRNPSLLSDCSYLPWYFFVFRPGYWRKRFALRVSAIQSEGSD